MASPNQNRQPDTGNLGASRARLPPPPPWCHSGCNCQFNDVTRRGINIRDDTLPRDSRMWHLWQKLCVTVECDTVSWHLAPCAPPTCCRCWGRVWVSSISSSAQPPSSSSSSPTPESSPAPGSVVTNRNIRQNTKYIWLMKKLLKYQILNIRYENHDIAIAMSSSRADPLGPVHIWRLLLRHIPGRPNYDKEWSMAPMWSPRLWCMMFYPK